ncbi:MAG: hypothetical protein COB15_11150 [Flavobacteriales bacterium]|nr:MAG: hypothetical protein COB15_11150 [Flavobacteriales bacterium]
MSIQLKHIVLIIIVFSFTKNAFPQHYQEGNFGINIGVVFAIGTHIDRFGGSVNAFYKTDHFQINPEFRIYFNAKNLGPNKSSIESVFSLGVVYGYGNKDTLTNNFYSSVSNQTQRKNSFGYAYSFYLNDIETNQRTGTFSIEVNNFSFITENDLFSGTPQLDRFRTAGVLIQYQKDKMQFGVNTTLFTGQMGERVTDSNYPFVGIYENTVGGKYTEFSHGLLSAQFKYAGNYFQNYQANIGVDSERIRHAVQNRFGHDILIGHGINAHVPMLDDKGKQYLFKEGQKVKPMKFYMNLFSNPATFY